MRASTRLWLSLPLLLLLPVPNTSLASTRIELSLGGTLPRTDFHEQPHTDLRPSIATVLSVQPKPWPIGVVAYASATALFFEGITFAFPEDDFITANHRLFDGDVGVGLEKEFWSGSTRIAAGAGLMTGMSESRVTANGKAKVTKEPGSGPWVTAALSQRLSKRFEAGGRALYAWKGVSTSYDWERKGGGLLLGLGVGYQIAGSPH